MLVFNENLLCFHFINIQWFFVCTTCQMEDYAKNLQVVPLFLALDAN